MYNILKKFKNIFIKKKDFFFTTIIIIIFFAICYILFDFNEQTDENNNTSMFSYNNVPNKTVFQKIYNKFYLSISTLTTLGFGDIYPRHPLPQTVIGIQTFLSFFLISELITK